ncbi:MAG: hypothetical protein NTU90_08730, partial [Proteobacteria bacterium]|nr:hypothetical protein [Pseudomonadota bacterium]
MIKGKPCPSFLIIIITIIFSIISFLSCEKQERRNRSDTIILAFPSEPHRLNPAFISDFNSYTVSGWIFNGLTKLDDDV